MTIIHHKIDQHKIIAYKLDEAYLGSKNSFHKVHAKETDELTIVVWRKREK
jgi:hypothetical protein